MVKQVEKKVATKYQFANILSLYPTAPEPSEIDFPAQSTSEIDLITPFCPIPPRIPAGAQLIFDATIT